MRHDCLSNCCSKFSAIESSKKFVSKTGGQVYAVDKTEFWTPLSTSFARFGLSKDCGEVCFTGESASLFKKHVFEGFYTGLKRACGQYTTASGYLEWDEAELEGRKLIVKRARLIPGKGRSPVSLWARRLGPDGWFLFTGLPFYIVRCLGVFLDFDVCGYNLVIVLEIAGEMSVTVYPVVIIAIYVLGILNGSKRGIQGSR